VTRAEALEMATKTVTTVGTNARGYNDHSLAERVAAIERLARFLMGDSE
jgi:hypothetical protein